MSQNSSPACFIVVLIIQYKSEKDHHRGKKEDKKNEAYPSFLPQVNFFGLVVLLLIEDTVSLWHPILFKR